MVSLPEKFFARRAHNARNGNYFSLRIVYPTSHLPGDRSSEFGRLRMERDGWNAWGEDEDSAGRYAQPANAQVASGASRAAGRNPVHLHAVVSRGGIDERSRLRTVGRQPRRCLWSGTRF